jgi:predicted nucleic acid-binding protein
MTGLGVVCHDMRLHPVPAEKLSAARSRLRGGLNHSAHLFWPDDASIVGPRIVDGTRVHSARQITDTYLLALAFKHGGRLVTFDSGIALAAVKGATARQLVTLV